MPTPLTDSGDLISFEMAKELDYPFLILKQLGKIAETEGSVNLYVLRVMSLRDLLAHYVVSNKEYLAAEKRINDDYDARIKAIKDGLPRNPPRAGGARAMANDMLKQIDDLTYQKARETFWQLNLLIGKVGFLPVQKTIGVLE